MLSSLKAYRIFVVKQHVGSIVVSFINTKEKVAIFLNNHDCVYILCTCICIAIYVKRDALYHTCINTLRLRARFTNVDQISVQLNQVQRLS